MNGKWRTWLCAPLFLAVSSRDEATANVSLEVRGLPEIEGAEVHVMSNKYALRPTDLGSPKDNFVLRFNDRDVGRTYAEPTPQGPRWFWSIYGINLRGPLPEGVVLQGLADDLAAAGAAFKANWEKLLSAGSVKPEK
jgi:hypothetical protein